METAALPAELYAFGLLYFGLLVERVLPLMGTVFLELQFFLNITPVLAGRIIAPLTLSALKRYQFHHILFARHNKPSLLSRVSGVVNRMLPRSGSKTSPILREKSPCFQLWSFTS